MPKGVYEHHPRKRITKDTLKAFVLFTFRDDIAKRLERERYPHQVAVKLYQDETGIVISSQTAYKQRDKWEHHIYRDTQTGKIIREDVTEVLTQPRHKRATKADISRYIEFRNRDDIKDYLKDKPKPFELAVDIFEQETGIHISVITARRKEPQAEPEVEPESEGTLSEMLENA